MANSDDLTGGQGLDEQLQKLEATPGFDSDDPASIVAALWWLDRAAGVQQTGDYYLVHPAMGWLLSLVTATDPAVIAAIAAANESEDETDGDDSLVTQAPFEVEFRSPEGPDIDSYLPEFMRGNKVLVRFMTPQESESGRLTFVHSVHADGTFIVLPPASKFPVNVAELNT